MIKKYFSLYPMFCLIFYPIYSHSNTVQPFQHPFYLGAIAGYGSTTWDGLVPSQKNQNIAINMSTPIAVTEGGAVWGLLMGYEFAPYFALEANYIHYSKATVSFDEMSLFSFTNDGLLSFITKTETISFMGKLMILIPNTKIRAYSSAGIAELHRDDNIVDSWRLRPTFGLGINYHLTDRITSELGANYTAGLGESQLKPSDSYFPFLYSISLRLAYCF
jgi:hypothetical protein